MKKYLNNFIISFILIISIALGTVTVIAEETKAEKAGYEYEIAVNLLNELEITTCNEFNENDFIKRADFAVYLGRLIKVNEYEIAKESGINLKNGYNGDLTSKEAGTIGGNIVRKVFESYTGNNYFKKNDGQ